MSCNPRNLSKLCSAPNGFTLWHYLTGKDTTEDIYTQGYFGPVADLLRKGDMILADVNGVSVNIVLVSLTRDGVVDIAGMTAAEEAERAPLSQVHPGG